MTICYVINISVVQLIVTLCVRALASVSSYLCYIATECCMNSYRNSMEVESPFPKYGQGKRLKLSPIPRRLLFPEDDQAEDKEVFQEKLAAVQRRLSFDNENSLPIEDTSANETAHDAITVNMNDSDAKTDPDSPPYKRLKSLRVFDSSTPFTGRTTPPSKNSSLISAVSVATPRIDFRVTRFKPCVGHNSSLITRYLNVAPVNPFTPDGRVIVSESMKRKQKFRKTFQDRLSGSSCDDSLQNTSKSSSESEIDDKSIVGTSLSELETSRFAEEFKVDSFIASGYYGCVYKCTNYLDGMEYAIKKSAAPVAGTKNEHLARKEVFALAALKSHRHIVTYYSSWIEDGHLFIQTEYCNGSSLDTLINENKKVFTECGLRRLANHVAKGLKHIHASGLAHMDIKPSNILICRMDSVLTSDEDLDEVDRDDVDILYKIADLGHVIVIDKPYDVVDGDCRYIPRELLNEDYNNVQKADIFSFGMTLFEAAGGGPLPKNGDEWQQLRDGDIPYLNKYSSTINQIIKSMLHPEPEKRPELRQILQQTRFISETLQQQIFSWKVKSDFYQQQVKAQFSSLIDNHTPIICADSIPKIFVEHAS